MTLQRNLSAMYLTCDENGFAQSKACPMEPILSTRQKAGKAEELMDDFEVYIAQDGQTYRYPSTTPTLRASSRCVGGSRKLVLPSPMQGAGSRFIVPMAARWEMTFTYPTPTTIDTFCTNAEAIFGQHRKSWSMAPAASLVEVQAPMVMCWTAHRCTLM
ncbi:MAG: hypothetical protein ACLTLQ_10890 [[Clostridium] scindens]